MKLSTTIEILVLVLLASMIACSGYSLETNAVSGDNSKLWSNPLGSGNYASPIWSPNGDYLAFTYQDIGRDQLWIFEKQTGELFQIPADIPGHFMLLSGTDWRSNSSLWVAYHTKVKRGENGDILLVDINIEEKSIENFINLEELVTLYRFELNGFSFVTENLLILSITDPKESDNDLYQINIVSEDLERLTNTPNQRERSPLVSYDDKLLTYFKFDGEVGQLIVQDLSSGIENAFDVSIRSSPSRFSWSPDSRSILYVGRYNNSGLFLFDLTTQASHRILGEAVASVAWSPDGKYVAYTTVGVPGRNYFYIVEADELGLNTD